MKTRKGFVSNSSTTSFTCEACGNTWAGSDSLSYADAGYFNCINGHVLCEEHKLDVPDLTNQEKCDIMVTYYKDWPGHREEIQAYDPDDMWDHFHDFEYDYGVSERYCPICQFFDISNTDTAAFLLKETGVPRDEAFAFVKKQNKRRKKLYDTEYVMYVQMHLSRDISMLPAELKVRFGTYGRFQEWLREK